ASGSSRSRGRSTVPRRSSRTPCWWRSGRSWLIQAAARASSGTWAPPRVWPVGVSATILAALRAPIIRPPTPGEPLELPASHRVPVTWLLEHGSESIRLRTRRELAYPPITVSSEALAAEEEAVVDSKLAQTVVKKQKDTGVWGGNLLALAPSAKEGIKEIGTIPQYRRLLQLGYPRSGRAFKLADRLLFRLLSRDDDPILQFEFAKLSKDSPEAAEWARDHMR